MKAVVARFEGGEHEVGAQLRGGGVFEAIGAGRVVDLQRRHLAHVQLADGLCAGGGEFLVVPAAAGDGVGYKLADIAQDADAVFEFGPVIAVEADRNNFV